MQVCTGTKTSRKSRSISFTAESCSICCSQCVRTSAMDSLTAKPCHPHRDQSHGPSHCASLKRNAKFPSLCANANFSQARNSSRIVYSNTAITRGVSTHLFMHENTLMKTTELFLKISCHYSAIGRREDSYNKQRLQKKKLSTFLTTRAR